MAPVQLLLTDKYSPKKLENFIGNEDALGEIHKWALECERNKAQKPLLLHGPPGVGKTAVAHALASEFNWTLIETNTSDQRDPEALRKLVGAGGRGLFNEQRLILIDEIDGAFERGEVPELVKLIRENDRPMILTANDLWHKNLAGIRPLCKAIELKKVNYRAIASHLARIAATEGLRVEKAQVETIARNSSGDVRAAVIDLQAGNTDAGARDRQANVFEAVRAVFKTAEYGKSIAASENLDIDLDTFVKWIEENIPIEYEAAVEKSTAFNWLSKSDVMQGRIKHRQYWGLLRYVRAFSHAGVSLSKKGVYHKFSPYQFPTFIRALSASKAKRAAIASLCEKLAVRFHCSRKKISADLPLIAAMPLGSYVELNEEEAAALKALSARGKLVPDEKQKRSHKEKRNQVSGV